MGLFSIIARLTGDTTDFDRKMTRSMSKANQTVSKAAGMIKGQLAAAFGVAAIVALEKRVIDFGAKVKDTSDRLGISSDAVQELAFAAEQGGASFETLSAALTRFGKLRGDILAGSGDLVAKKNLERLGISNEELAANSTVDLFKKIGGILGASQGNDDRGAIASTLFGRSGEQLLPVFDSGLEQMAMRLRDIGGVIDSSKIAELKQAADSLTDIKMQMLAIGAEAAPMLNDALGFAVSLVKTVQEVVTDAATGVLMSMDNKKGYFANVTSIGDAKREAKALKAKADKEAADKVKEGIGTLLPATPLPPVESILKASTGAGASFNLSAGSLASIGGFVGLGGSRNATVSISQKQLDKLNEIARLLEDKETITLE